MKKTIFALAILATIFTSCGTPAKEETTADSTAVAVDTTAVLADSAATVEVEAPADSLAK